MGQPTIVGRLGFFFDGGTGDRWMHNGDDWELWSNDLPIITVANEAALASLKPTMKVFNRYIITLMENGATGVTIEIKYKDTTTGDYYYEVVSGGVKVLKVI